MEDLKQMKKETIRLICECNSLHWMRTIYTYVRLLIGWVKSRVITRLFYAGNNFEESSDSKTTQSSYVVVSDKEEEKEKDIDIEEKVYI